MKKNLIETLQSCKSFAPVNPVDISAELQEWELAENYDATEVSIYSAEGKEIFESIAKIYTRYSDVREDNGTYYATYWSVFKRIPEAYDILIVLAESLRYYEEQIPTYTQIAVDIFAARY